MAATEIKVQMQQRRDTAAGWTSSNPTLLAGELGFETDTYKFKLGDGTTVWTSLAYASVDQDKLVEGNTEAEVVDTGSDGHFKITTEGTERLRVGPAGQIGIAGANYGQSGETILSGGPSGAVTWGSPAAGGSVILESQQTISADYTLTTNYNGLSSGTVAVDAGVTVTVPANAVWTIL